MNLFNSTKGLYSYLGVNDGIEMLWNCVGHSYLGQKSNIWQTKNDSSSSIYLFEMFVRLSVSSCRSFKWKCFWFFQLFDFKEGNFPMTIQVLISNTFYRCASISKSHIFPLALKSHLQLSPSVRLVTPVTWYRIDLTYNWQSKVSPGCPRDWSRTLEVCPSFNWMLRWSR